MQSMIIGQQKDQERSSHYKNRFLIKKGHQLISLKASDIRYFYSKDKLTFVNTVDNKEYIIGFTIEQLEKLVSPEYFFRVSRKYIISHAAISKVLLWFNGKLRLEIQPGNPEGITISRDRVSGFKAWMGE